MDSKKHANQILRKSKELSVGEKMWLLTKNGLLKSGSLKFEKLQKRGTDFNNAFDKKMNRWVKLETSFKSRIRTGIIINIKHKNLNSFLDDAKEMIISQMKNIPTYMKSLEVNITLEAKFIAIEDCVETKEKKKIPIPKMKQYSNQHILTNGLKLK